MSPSSLPPSSAGRRAAGPSLRDAVVIGLFGLGLLGSLIVPLTDGDGVEDPAVWAEVVEGLAPTLSAGTTILVQPPWRDDVLDHFDARAAAGKPVLPPGVGATVALARSHASWPGRVVLIADTTQALPASLKRRLSDVETDERNGLLVAVLDAPAAEPTSPGAKPSTATNLDSLLARAKVTVTTGEKVTRCVYEAGSKRHQCPGEPEWMYVAPFNMSSGGQSKRCLWAHPAKNGLLRITFPKVTLGGALELQHALADGAVRNGGSPVDVRVLVDDKEIGRSRRTNAVTFAKRRFPTTPGKVADISFEVSARHDGARHHCLSARLLPASDVEASK